MKNNFLILVFGMFFIASAIIPLTQAHVIEEGPQTKSSGDYEISFSTNPKFPVTYKKIHLDFIIEDKKGNEKSGLNVRIEIHKSKKSIELTLQEESKGHYSIENKFIESGIYEIHPIINGQELETEFILEVDGFGRSGLFRLGVIIIFILILLILMRGDCKK